MGTLLVGGPISTCCKVGNVCTLQLGVYPEELLHMCTRSCRQHVIVGQLNRKT